MFNPCRPKEKLLAVFLHLRKKKDIYLRPLNNTFIIYVTTYRYIMLVINYTRDLL
jgi:hypothetical protein